MARRRSPRTESLVRSAIADLIETEVADPRVRFVTITEVEVTPDHDVATVWYTTLDPDLVSRDPARTGGDRVPAATEVAAGLESATSRLRAMLARRVDLRVVPDLRFRPDPVAEQSAKVEELLRRLSED
ncbi:MAG: 30S ribosome-binding factor RbfA [Nitriliruptoraceae bacterium]